MDELTFYEQSVINAITQGFDGIAFLILTAIVSYFLWQGFVWFFDRFIYWPSEYKNHTEDIEPCDECGGAGMLGDYICPACQGDKCK